jgi:hypothetical protein
MASSSAKGPLLLFAAAPADGHVNPVLRVAGAMIERGYDAVFLSSPEFKDRVEKIGAEWSHFEPLDLSDFVPEKIAALKPKSPLQILSFAFQKVFLASLVKHTQQLREALEMLHRRDPEREVIVFHEFGSMGVHPFVSRIPQRVLEKPQTPDLSIPCWEALSKATS